MVEAHQGDDFVAKSNKSVSNAEGVAFSGDRSSITTCPWRASAFDEQRSPQEIEQCCPNHHERK